MKKWHFFDKVYRKWVVVCVGPKEEFIDFMKSATYKDIEELEDESVGFCVYLCDQNTTNGNDCFVVYLKEWNLSVLVHELTHLVHFIFENVGVQTIPQNTETVAYYTQFWFNEITRARRRLPNGRTPTEAKKYK